MAFSINWKNDVSLNYKLRVCFLYVEKNKLFLLVEHIRLNNPSGKTIRNIIIIC
jgi:hypothetical protein